MKAIIFGANGQDGFFLSKLLEKKGVAVIGVSRSGNFNKTNIASFTEVAELIKSIAPDFVFHLAANSTTRHDALFENHETISTGTFNILEAVRIHAPNTKVFISGSGLQFENKNLPIKETDPFEARDAYSVSRIQSVYAARYFRTLGLKVYVGYFFNHDSPRRSERHMAQKIAATARNVAKGVAEKLEIGDMSVIKEWTYAGDVVEGIWLFVNQDEIFETNISSGIGYSILDWVKVCFGLIGKDYQDYISEKNSFTAEYRQLVSDAGLIKSLGFNPKVSFEDLAKMMIDE
ncbi:MAG: GDP-mannose 4,6-dehydratase [Bacteroidota bacterium]